MEKNIDLRSIALKFKSVDTTISGPHDASNGKNFFKAQFEVAATEDDGFCGQSKAYTKCFFEDSHSLLYRKAQEALDNNTPLKIKAARVIIPTEKEFYILDENGEKRKKADGTFAKASSITLFLIADENPVTAFRQQFNQITRNNAWVEPELADDDDDDAEEKKAKDIKKK